MADTALELRSLIKKSGELELSLAKVPVPEPGDDQVVIKVEATPINPSDLGLLLGPADMSAAKATGSGDSTKVTAQVPPGALTMLRRAARPVDAGRQRGRGHGGQGRQVAGSAGAYRQDRVDGRRRHVRAVPAAQGKRLPCRCRPARRRPRARRGSSIR